MIATDEDVQRMYPVTGGAIPPLMGYKPPSVTGGQNTQEPNERLASRVQRGLLVERRRCAKSALIRDEHHERDIVQAGSGAQPT
jgi:hypothetical protein